MIDVGTLRQLVDWERGLISARIFADEEIYALEMERLFGRTWLFLAHESQLNKPGDFFSTFMGADPVVAVRQKDGSIKAFLNACRHRGMKVCRADEGNAKAFTCVYHGWSYDTSGRLVNVPNLEDAYFGELALPDWGLLEVAQVESWNGLVFGNFDPTAPPLVEYLGDMQFYMGPMFDRTDGGTELIGGVHKWTVSGNWKLAAEQFAGDAYHGGVSHTSATQAIADGPGVAEKLGQTANRQRRSDLGALQFSSRLGHGAGVMGRLPDDMLVQLLSASRNDLLIRYETEVALPEMEARLGRARARAFGHATLFPNFSWLPNVPSIRVWHPKGPNEFECWAWIIVDRDMPADVKEALRLQAIRLFSPGGTIEQDDGENWGHIGRNVTTSPRIRSMTLNYTMGLGHERTDDPDYPGLIGSRFYGDVPQRGFYRRWLEFLTSDGWPSMGDVDIVATAEK